MRIRKNFSSISELEERAFCEGYMYAQKEFADQILTNDTMAERLNRQAYEHEMEKRKKKRMGGYVMSALGAAGIANHVQMEPKIYKYEKKLLKRVADSVDKAILESGNTSMSLTPEQAEKVRKIRKEGIAGVKKGTKKIILINRGLGLGAAALTAGGIYRANKKANSNMTYEDWLAEKNNQNKN